MIAYLHFLVQPIVQHQVMGQCQPVWLHRVPRPLWEQVTKEGGVGVKINNIKNGVGGRGKRLVKCCRIYQHWYMETERGTQEAFANKQDGRFRPSVRWIQSV